MALGEYDLLFQFGAIVFLSLLLGTLVEFVGIPSIVGYLISGLLLGPQGLDLIKSSEIVDLFASLGIILLLFFTGLKMDPRKFGEAGTYAIFLSPIKSGAVFLLGFIIAKGLGFNMLEAFVVGAALAGSSTAIISHAILEKGWSNRKEARVAMSMLVLEDILSIFFIAYLLSMINVEIPVIKVFFHTFALAFMVFVLGTLLVWRLFSKLGKYVKEEYIPLYALGLITLFSYGVSLLGISPVLGAFFAGLALANTNLSSYLYERMTQYRHFFVMFFFTSLGLKYLISFSPLAIALGILASIAVWVQVFVVLFMGPLLGIEPQRALRLGILMLPLGEFSLFFSAVAQELSLPHAADMMGGMFLAIIITTLIAGVLIRREKEIEHIFERLFPALMKERSAFIRPAATSTFISFYGSIPPHMRRFLSYFLAAYLMFYFTGYLLTEVGVGLITFIVMFTASALVLAFSYVELKKGLDSLLFHLHGKLYGGKVKGISSGYIGSLLLIFGGFMLLTAISLKILSLLFLSATTMGYGILLLLYSIAKIFTSVSHGTHVTKRA